MPIHPTPQRICNALKKHNAPAFAVLWQNKQIGAKLARDSKRDIDVYDATAVHNGHFTSSCDPFLLLLAHLFRWRIVHTYAGNPIVYSHPVPFAEVRLRSSTSHIDFAGRTNFKTCPR